MRKSLCFLLALCIMNLVPALATQPTTPLGKNVAFGKSVFATSKYGDTAQYAPENIVDGYLNSEWAVGYAPNVAQGFIINLGLSFNINEIRFKCRVIKGQDAERNAFKVELSNDINFTNGVTVYSVANDATPLDAMVIHSICVDLPAAYQYVRFVKTNGLGTSFSMAEVQVFTGDETANVVEICKNKPASADYSWQGISPSAGNDGNNSTAWFNKWLGNNYCNWRVDLGKDYKLYDILQINFMVSGIDHDPYCNKDFKVQLSNNANFSDAVEVYKQVPQNETDVVTGENVIKLQTKNNQYRYLRLIKNNPGGTLVVNEVLVFANKIAGENVALNKAVTANSNHYTKWYPATKAVDGVYEGDGAQWKSDPYVQPEFVEFTVDLGSIYNLKTILYTMGDTVPSINNFQIQLSEDNVFTAEDVVHTVTTAIVPYKTETLTLPKAKKARYIKIKKTETVGSGDYNFMAIVELEAFADENVLPETIEFKESYNSKNFVTSIPPSNDFVVNYLIPNNEQDNITVYQVGYKNELLRSIKTYDMNIPANAKSLIYTENLSLKGDNSTSYRFFIWKNGILSPICNDTKLNRN